MRERKEGMKKRTLIILLALWAGSTCIARAGTVTLTLNPVSGTMAGQPGATVGWGFTLTNTLVACNGVYGEACYGVITASQFDPTPNAADGIYTDFIGPNFIVVGPLPESETVVQSFDPNALTGVGSFTIAPSAIIGDIVLGQIVLTYDVYSVSPNAPGFDPFLDTLANGLQVSAPAQVDVVPEPGSLLLLLTASGLSSLLVALRPVRSAR